jgi:hypothetical protein
VDGEGNFYVKIIERLNKRPIISLVFSISQHSRDTLLMNKILDYLNCGVIEQPRSRKEVRFVVYKFNDHLEKIISFFDKYNLQSIKILNFNDYKIIANFLKDRDSLSNEDFITIKKIKSRMNKGRVF